MSRQPRGTHLYVGGVALAAAAVAAATVHAGSGRAGLGLGLSALLLSMMVAAEYLQVRYLHGRQVDALNFVEAAAAPLLFAATGVEVVVVIAASMAIAGLARRNAPIKVAFNVAQWTLAAGCAALTLWWMQDQLTGAFASDVGSLLVALAVLSAVNQACISLLMLVLTGHVLGSQHRGHGAAVAIGRVTSAAVCMALGVLLIGAYAWHPWTLAASFVPMALIHWASKGLATARADRMRLAGLQQATHALAFSFDAGDAFPPFLAEVRAAFEVRAAELVVFEGDITHVHRCTGRVNDFFYEVAAHPLADAVGSALVPARLTVQTADERERQALTAIGAAETIVAPLRSHGAVIGFLFLHDRAGMEGFEEGELAVASALAAEVVGFVERTDLMRSLVDERRKLAEIVDNASDGILTVDDGGTIRSWNPAFADMTGFTTAQMIGNKHLGLLRVRDRDGNDVLLEQWPLRRHELPTELEIRTADGESVWLSCAYSEVPASEDQRSALVVVARNVTQAHELEKLKDDFVAIVSHELRTPLVGIKGFTSTLLSRGDRMSPEQREKALQAVLRQSQRLEQLVLNILEAARIEARGAGAGNNVADVNDMAVKVVDEVVSARPDRVVRLTQPARPVVVRGSSVWLERALANLVGNAVKYSPETEPVDVVVSVEDGDAVVRVTDRGPGIARESRERIFDRFERLDDAATQPGTGLGLYITRQLVRAMGGTVTVDSVGGAGSTFTMRVPLLAMELPDQRSDSAPARVVRLG